MAYFLPPDWGRVARHAAPALERGTDGAVRLLILVPDAVAALALARALDDARAPEAPPRRIIAATSAARVARLLAAGSVDAIVGAPEVITAALATAKLKLDQLGTVVFAAADELDADAAELAAVLSEVPRDAARILTALSPTTGVESLIERYLPHVRRVTEDVAPAAGSAVAATVRFLTVSGSPVDALPMVLDELDAPSATVLAADDATADAARALLRAIGYGESALATVTVDEVKANTSLVVALGIPGATAWQQAVNAQPSQIVAIVSPRDLPALQLLSGASEPRPLTDRASVSRARTAESRRRAELRAALTEGIPSREVLALEPLLREFDGLEIAAAALRLLEKARAEQTELVHAAEVRVRTQMREAQKEKDAEERASRGRSDGPRPFKPRGEGREGPRSFKPRGDDRGPRDGPRAFKPRGDDRDGPRPFKPRGDDRDGPRPFKPRGPRPPRGDR